MPTESELVNSEKITNYSVRVVCDMPSSVYIHQYFKFRADAALVLPVESLGNQYYVMTYHGYSFQGTEYPSEFAVIAVEDQTTIRIKYACTTAAGKLKDQVDTILLSKGQSYQVQAINSNNDLSGTYISSDKYVAVFSGNRWTQIPNGYGNRDNLLEQMIPIEVWGKKFVAVPSKYSTADRYRVIASEDNTIVTLSGNGTLPGPINLMKGQWKEFELNATAAYIQSNKPIMIAMFLVGGDYNGMNNRLGDPSMVLLNSIEQFRDTVTLYNSPFENIVDNFINIITSTKDTSTLRVDGRTIRELNHNFKLIGPQNEHAYVQLSVNSGAHLLLSESCGLIAIAYGYGQAESYAYGGGANFTKLNKVPIPDGSCLRDTILFYSGLTKKRYNVTWDLGDGTISTSDSIRHVYKNLGDYSVRLFIHDLCRDQFDSVEKVIKITLRENLIAYPDTLICEGSDVNLFSKDRMESTYKWTGPNNFKSEDQILTLKNIKLSQSGKYTVTGYYFGCPTYPIELNLEVKANPKPNLGKDTFFCPLKASLELQVDNFSSILWDDNSRSNHRTITQEGLYSVYVTDEFNCLGSDSIFVADKCPLNIYIPNVFSPNGDQINDEFILESSNVKNFHMDVFTRWGERVFQSDDIQKAWTGNIDSGDPALPGVYVYYIYAEGYNDKGEYLKEHLTGNFTLLR